MKRHGKTDLLLAGGDGEVGVEVEMPPHCRQNQQVRAKRPLRSRPDLPRLRRERFLAAAGRNAGQGEHKLQGQTDRRAHFVDI